MSDQEVIPAGATPLSTPQLRVAARSPNPLTMLRSFADQPAVRRSLPALGGGAALLMAGAAWWAMQSPNQTPVYAGLADGDKAAVADALQTAGIPYTIDRDTGNIAVGEDDVHKARMMLAGQGLPKAAPGGDAVLSSLPMGASRALEGETLRGAREADLARTIEAIDSVKSARIHLATPEPSPFVRDDSAPAASVMLTMESGRSLSNAQVSAIKHLVASSVPGLSPADVSVVDQTGALLSQDDGGVDDKNFQLQLKVEERYRAAVTALLAPMLGAENFSTEVHADVDFSESQSTRESYPKDDRALRREEGNKSTNSATQSAAGGIPGALSNKVPQATQVAVAPGGVQTTATPSTPTSTGEIAETYSRNFDVGREISVTHQPVGRVRRLTIAVALRDAVGGKKRSKVELAQIDSLVKGAVGFDQARGDIVAISARPFAKAEESTTNWWDNPLIMVGLRQAGGAIVALLVLLFIGRPLLRMLKEKAETAKEEADLERKLLGATAPGSSNRAMRNVTLEMIEAAPSYEERASLVRNFVKQDAARAALVVRQLVQERADG
ncbi:flagellar basal-body MS-ring/collar protein FliF [Aquisediminimonas profunda]|uniref:flagellar basal-body MS-ring/collar protein FliF n=1 Tax=Aquisediminimonas profunda TaxID=1550733 RepID=UPI001C631129|nr:flagellar basal-body MS-ring/collar protein FliF [Aquisediminimonas profunda]